MLLKICTMLFSVAFTRKYVASVNLALNKPAYLSSTYKESYANKSVEGTFSQNFSSCSQGNDTSGGPNWLVVDLLRVYHISQVVLTPRIDMAYDEETKRMDYPYIGITNVFDINKYPPVRHAYVLCRQSPYNASKYKNMSIECRPNTPPGRYVIVQQPVTGPGSLLVCEIQVFSTNNTAEVKANELCTNGFYGEYCDKLCYCDKNVACDRKIGTCPDKCDDNWTGEHCDKRIDYYKKQLMGCFDKNQLNLQMLSTSNNSCLDECSGYGFDFAAVWDNSACLCGNKDVWNKFHPLSCGQYIESCAIYPSRKCTYGPKILLFSVCPNGTYGYNCSLKCNCVDNTRCRYMNGYCELGCSYGWSGSSCNIREITNIPAIIGGVVGIVGGLFVIVAIAILIYKIKHRKKNPPSQEHENSQDQSNEDCEHVYEKLRKRQT